MGDRVATLAWNGYRHMELYYAVSGSGAVLHTINPRLHPEQIAYIVNHADDQYVFSAWWWLYLINVEDRNEEAARAQGKGSNPKLVLRWTHSNTRSR